MNMVLPNFPVWLIVLIVGLPQLSETVYTPSLPDIARGLNVTESYAEYTLTIYLAAFALGIFFWGIISDYIGRRPCTILGLILYLIGCIGCLKSGSIELLMTSRFVQAFGASVGSVLGQAMCRDTFQGSELSKAYAFLAGSIAFFRAAGPLIGGTITQWFSWNIIFLFLIFFGIGILCLVFFFLPETLQPSHEKRTSIFSLIYRMARDPRVVGSSLIMGVCNGLSFSYFAEGSFYLISLLGLSPRQYGSTFTFIAIATIIGSYFSRRLNEKEVAQKKIILLGIGIIISGAALSLLFVLGNYIWCFENRVILVSTIAGIMIIMSGLSLVSSNVLALALARYQRCIGSASSLFGCSYYSLVSIVTFVMGYLHNGTLFPMPFYFFCLGLLMFLFYKKILVKSIK